MSPGFENILLEIKESFVMALAALRTNKLRSGLTLLGISVGVFSIIGVMTAMGVMVNSIESGMSQLGAHTFQVQRMPNFHSNDPQERARMRRRKYIRYDQALAVKEKTTLAKAVGLEAWSFGKVVTSPLGEKTNPNVQLAGEDVEGFVTNNWNISDGRLFTQEELVSKKNVTILGQGVADKLFPKMDPFGQTVRVDGEEYHVIGILEEKGDMLGGNQDFMLIIPLTTFFSVYGKDRDLHIMVQTAGPETFDDCIEQVRGILRTARQVAPGQDDDFHIFSNDSLIEQFNEMTEYVRLGIMLISAIALIAAGVGIMNIMLVSVTERTREIGVRKAIGARKNNILAQFILEAVVLSQLGGIAGILLGIAAGNAVALFFEIPPIFPYEWAAIGFIICSIIGIVFGVYPAWKAANLDPIDALRYE